jgi:hypothetical protein
VLNQGVEVAVNVTAVNKRNVRWDVRGAANTLRNELTSLGGISPFALGGVGRALKGQQLGVMVAKRVRSVDAAANRVVVSDTLEPVGNLFPTLEWNITNTLTLFKNLRIAALLDAKRDFVVYNNTRFFRETQLVRSNLRLDPTALPAEERLRRFGPFVSEANGSAVPVNDAREPYIERGDFVRLRELSATYDVPRSLTDKLGKRVQGASVTLAFQNVRLWSDFSGADPEVNSQTGAFAREDFLTVPLPRRSMLRFNLNF